MLIAIVVFALVAIGAGYVLFAQKKPHIGNESRNYRILPRWHFTKRLLVLVGLSTLAATSAWTANSQSASFPTGSRIVLLVDVSKSMLTEDAEGPNGKISRLDAAKSKALDLLGQANGHPVSLVAFAGESRTLIPFTLDVKTLGDAISALTTDSVSQGGSDLPGAATSTLSRFDPNEIGEIVLYSDGDDQPADFTNVEPLVRSHPNVRIDTVGVGGSDPQPIPLSKDMFGNVRYKQVAGEVIKTKLEDANLRSLAKLGRGTYSDNENPKALVLSNTANSRASLPIALMNASALLTLLWLILPYRRWKK